MLWSVRGDSCPAETVEMPLSNRNGSASVFRLDVETDTSPWDLVGARMETPMKASRGTILADMATPSSIEDGPPPVVPDI